MYLLNIIRFVLLIWSVCHVLIHPFCSEILARGPWQEVQAMMLGMHIINIMEITRFVILINE